MRKTDVFLKEYVSQLNLDDLRYIFSRLDNRIGSDLAEALNAVSKQDEIDEWLQSAKNSDEFYDMVDSIQEYVEREIMKRAPELISV